MNQEDTIVQNKFIFWNKMFNLIQIHVSIQRLKKYHLLLNKMGDDQNQ